MQKFILGFLILLIGSCMTVFAEQNKNEIVLVLDTQNSLTLPRNFRIAAQKENKNINWSGFKDLHIAGGAQFSRLGLEKIWESLGRNKLVIIDLRQESHGFINGSAITWYGPHDAANAGKTDRQIERIQANLLSQLSKQKEVTVYKILKKSLDEIIEEKEPIKFAVHAINSEKEIAEQHQFQYRRIYAQDFHAPETKEVDRFLKIVKSLPEDHWIYFHCRAGVGRTTTFMVIYDMISNAKQVSFNDILARQVAIGGKELSELPEPGTYKYEFAKARLEFLQKFYEYARTNQDNFQTPWSKWLASHR